MFRRKIKKLNYRKVNIQDIEFNFCRSYCRTMHITIKSDGEIFFVVPYGTLDYEIEKFVSEKKYWIIKNVEKMKQKSENTDKSPYTKEELKILYDKINQLIKKYEFLMNVKIKSFTLREMKTRWGSCSYNKGTIRFNKKLARKPDEYIEYIVVHEMAHLFVPNHSKNFYDVVKKYLPNYKAYERTGKSV